MPTNKLKENIVDLKSIKSKIFMKLEDSEETLRLFKDIEKELKIKRDKNGKNK